MSNLQKDRYQQTKNRGNSKVRNFFKKAKCEQNNNVTLYK